MYLTLDLVLLGHNYLSTYPWLKKVYLSKVTVFKFAICFSSVQLLSRV